MRVIRILRVVIAQACGQRILDTLGDHEAMQAVAGILRRRTVDVKLLGAQQRRVLHDEILPQMHLALLRLETLRSTSEMKPDDPESAESSEMVREQGLNEAIDMISDAHRRLATMMRTTAPGAPHRLERDGMMHAIQTMLEQDFQNAFDEIEWRVSEETATAIDEVTPPAIAELIFAAVQEALRNAARHARGNDVHRHLRLTLSASYNREGHYLELIVADDGVAGRETTSGDGQRGRVTSRLPHLRNRDGAHVQRSCGTEVTCGAARHHLVEASRRIDADVRGEIAVRVSGHRWRAHEQASWSRRKAERLTGLVPRATQADNRGHTRAHQRAIDADFGLREHGAVLDTTVPAGRRHQVAAVGARWHDHAGRSPCGWAG